MIALILAASIFRVIDGDTVELQDHDIHVVVRILGIDCPESRRNAKCKKDGKDICEKEIVIGKLAKEYATNLLRQGDRAVLEPGDKGFKRDVYGRTLAYLKMYNGNDFGLRMVQSGACRNYDKYPHPRETEYQNAQIDAQNRPMSPAIRLMFDITRQPDAAGLSGRQPQ